MRRDELPELHYICPIENIRSIIERGILSHNRAARLRHVSVAMEEVQSIRRAKKVPMARPLHEYVNQYLNARNTMMYKVKEQHAELCMLRVSCAVLDLPRVVIADGNAATYGTRFLRSPDGLELIDAGMLFATFWTHPDIFETQRHRSLRCAEVLVPDLLLPRFLQGAYVSGITTREALEQMAPGLAVTVRPHIFFR